MALFDRIDESFRTLYVYRGCRQGLTAGEGRLLLASRHVALFMADPSHLPHELVLLVIEAACHIYVYSRPGWVASLCLVCRSVQNVVTPILYARLFIGQHNISRLDRLSRPDNRNCLSLVREVFAEVDARHGRDGGCIVDASFSSLARALNGVRVISGPSSIIEALAHWNPSLSGQLVSVFVTDVTVMWRTDQHCFATTLRSVTHLHIVVDMDIAPYPLNHFSALRGTTSLVHSLIFDLVFRQIEHLTTAELEDVTSTLDSVFSTAFSTFQRLILRPRCVLEENVRATTACLAAWAEVKRDPRIFVDDDVVPIFDEEHDRWLYETLYLEDALEGEALWQRGRQLWQGSSK